MKSVLVLMILATSYPSFSKEFKLEHGKAAYTVTHLVKTVKGESRDLKGKMVCAKSLCDFLVAIPVKSFVSSDSNRDLNMQTILETSRYPLVTVKGEIPENNLSQKNYEIKAKINFHGIEKEYSIKVNNTKPASGNVIVKLEDHGVSRPSLLTVPIHNDIPVDFSFDWVE